jgi:RNA polymerase I-specific transcription initiation factor RRN7
MERMINDNILPYLDFARTTFIPPEMFNRMNRDVRLALTPRVRSYLLQSIIANKQKSPAPLYLFEESRNFARMLNRHFGLTFPEINTPPISWRIISSLGGIRKSTPLI